MERIILSGQIKGSKSWDERGGYSWNYLSAANKEILKEYIID